VERLTHNDIPDVVQLYKRVWESVEPVLPGELAKAWTPNALEFTSWMEGVTYFAARRDRHLIGAVGCEISEGSCRLLHLAVDAEARREGVATALLHAAAEWARHNGCHSIYIDALSRFGQAAELFLHLGYVESGVLHRHYFGEDVRLFEKLL